MPASPLQLPHWRLSPQTHPDCHLWIKGHKGPVTLGTGRLMLRTVSIRLTSGSRHLLLLCFSVAQ